MVAATPAVGRQETAADVVTAHFSTAIKRLNVNAELASVLARPAREIKAVLPVRMEDGTLRMFEAYRVQHSDVRGPFLGGLRLTPGVSQEQLGAFATQMTLQCALANVPFGGAAGAVVCDPAELLIADVEAVVRRYTSRMHRLMGPYRDVHCPEIGSDARAMGWVLDEYSQIHEYTPACALGKQIEVGGVPRSDEALARGILTILRELQCDGRLKQTGLRVAISAVDEEKARLALMLYRAGCSVVAFSNGNEGVFDPGGLDIEALVDHIERGGALKDFGAAQTISSAELIESECDVLVPVGFECSLHGRNARRIRAKVIVEAASLCTTPAADTILSEKSIVVVPDLLTRVGTVVACYLEWNQNVQQVYCEEERVIREVEEATRRVYQATKARAAGEQASLREAAYCIGFERVARAEKLRLP